VDIGIALTDDEVLALAARAGRTWPTFLPTIDLRSEEVVKAAATRGARSLVARTLLLTELNDDRGSVPRQLEEMIEPILFGRRIIGTYVGRDNFRLDPSQPTIACYDPGHGQWVSEVISAVGIHYLRTAPSDGCTARVLAMITKAFEEGIPEVSEDSVSGSLCVVSTNSGEAARMIAVSKNEMRALRMLSDSELTEEIGMASSPAGALAYILHADVQAIS
jgi:hypothetical protein